MFRKREEEQRRREAVQQISLAAAEKRRVPLVRTDPEKISLVPKSSKAERTKSKEERHKGTNVPKFLQFDS